MIDAEKLIDAATEVRDGLPRVDWGVAFAELGEGNFDGAADLARVWLRRLGTAVSPDAHHSESEHFLILEVPRGSSSSPLARFAEHTHARILANLRGIAQPSNLRLPLLLFANIGAYYSYIADLYPEVGEFAASGGLFISAGYPHIVLSGTTRSEHESVLAHELTHALLAHLELPLWLNEGMAVSTERSLCGPAFALTEYEFAEHRAFWDEQTIQEFWSGSSFHRPDDGDRLSYQLAEILVRTLANDFEALAVFANLASYTDGGEAAACEVFDRSLADLASSFLGKGPWLPDPTGPAWQREE